MEFSDSNKASKLFVGVHGEFKILFGFGFGDRCMLWQCVDEHLFGFFEWLADLDARGSGVPAAAEGVADGVDIDWRVALPFVWL